ncbi:glutathione S-transferase family protein [Devosia rhodophyticola]|uniref:Glutathione S-transferase family protein n=1 Tax=Devosia rhodophyticola TaxID=3026423 RepID=A0ABY7Z0I5_9HYPH|nr:glutathione S-transferase family protein [Devosia rhodophyticola]WDR06654.1 glutathione S-transferase family protein [Devosia rhodophyticola]
MTQLVLHGGRRSPFVRRVALWLTLQGRAFERRDVGVFGADFEPFKIVNPLGRVPALTLANDQHLIESSAIIDYLEDSAAAGNRLIPATGEARLKCQQTMAIANATAEKGVAYVYETERRPAQLQWPDWRDRMKLQVLGGLAALEVGTPESGWFGGESANGTDIAVITAYDFVGTIKTIDRGTQFPRLAALSARANAAEQFAASAPG